MNEKAMLLARLSALCLFVSVLCFAVVFLSRCH